MSKEETPWAQEKHKDVLLKSMRNTINKINSELHEYIEDNEKALELLKSEISKLRCRLANKNTQLEITISNIIDFIEKDIIDIHGVNERYEHGYTDCGKKIIHILEEVLKEKHEIN